MPELPDITVYVERLEAIVGGQVLQDVRLRSPFVVRSVEPPLNVIVGQRVQTVGRLGKRILLTFSDGPVLVIHLMIAGRLRWRAPGAKLPGKNGLVAFDFEAGSLHLTEAGSKRRASIHLVAGKGDLADHDRGGLEVLDATLDAFRARLAQESHTLKRALTDPRLMSGIGNAYSDEILHRACLSPLTLTGKLSDDQTQRLFEATRQVLTEWTDRLRREVGDGFPEKVTAFRPEMAVHGRFKQPCPVCGTPVQRIVYAQNETNYCPTCQTGGRVLADRSLSRLLKDDWPRRADELE